MARSRKPSLHLIQGQAISEDQNPHPEEQRMSEKLMAEYLLELPVILTTDELIERGGRLAKLEDVLNEHEAHCESEKRKMKATEAQILAERAFLANVVRNKKEPRQVQVREVANFDTNMLAVIRQDTGEIVRDRPLTAEERQVNLFNNQATTGKRKRENDITTPEQ